MCDLVDPKAEAAKEIAKFGEKALDALTGLSKAFASVLGGSPSNLVGLFFADEPREKRIRNLNLLKGETEEILKSRGVKERVMNPALVEPILEGGANESDDSLRSLWAKLLAAASDPGRQSRIRKRFAETLREMDPLDAKVLAGLQQPPDPAQNRTVKLATTLSVSTEDIVASFANLERLGCIVANQNSPANPHLIGYGAVFLRAVGE